MSQAYNLFHKHALSALEANDLAAALQVVNAPKGADLNDSTPRGWPFYRDRLDAAFPDYDAPAVQLKQAVEHLAAQTMSEDLAVAKSASDAESLLARLKINSVPTNDPELRRSLPVLATMNSAIADLCDAVLHMGYQSHADKVLGREATETDFEAARTVYLQRQTETARSNREERLIAELNGYADAGREVIRNGGTVDAAWAAIKAAMVAGGR